MPNKFLQYDITHLIGLFISIGLFLAAGILIHKFTKDYAQVEIFWIPFLLLIGFILGNKFI